MMGMAQVKDLDFITTISPALTHLTEPERARCWHYGNPTRLNQVLLNFLSNAVKFTTTGYVECKVSILADDDDDDIASAREAHASVGLEGVEEEVEEGVENKVQNRAQGVIDHILIEVIDTGIDIKETSILFYDFIQATPDITRQYGGMGLRLSISRQLVNLIGGIVGIESSLGQGTKVLVKFPLKRAPVTHLAPHWHWQGQATGTNTSSGTSESSEVGTADGKSKGNMDIADMNVAGSDNTNGGNRITRMGMCMGMGMGMCMGMGSYPHILIAEDSLVNQKVLRRIIETLGYSDLTIASNGQEAVDMAISAREQHCPYHIIFMDCQMPTVLYHGWSGGD
jgi:CheY-like chemotaxis protein